MDPRADPGNHPDNGASAVNPETGHLIDTRGLTPREKALLIADGYEPIPQALHLEAVEELAGRRDTFVPLSGRSRLARHAADQRRKRRKAARAARKRNRRRGG